MKTLKLIQPSAILALTLLLCLVFGGFSLIAFQSIFTQTVFNILPFIMMVAVTATVGYIGFTACIDILA